MSDKVKNYLLIAGFIVVAISIMLFGASVFGGAECFAGRAC